MFFVWFLGWGVGGAFAFMKKTACSICTSLLQLVFPFPPPLIAVSESHVLWTATCAVISLVGSGLGTRLQGFIWRSADKVPV